VERARLCPDATAGRPSGHSTGEGARAASRGQARHQCLLQPGERGQVVEKSNELPRGETRVAEQTRAVRDSVRAASDLRSGQHGLDEPNPLGRGPWTAEGLTPHGFEQLLGVEVVTVSVHVDDQVGQRRRLVPQQDGCLVPVASADRAHLDSVLFEHPLEGQSCEDGRLEDPAHDFVDARSGPHRSRHLHHHRVAAAGHDDREVRFGSGFGVVGHVDVAGHWDDGHGYRIFGRLHAYCDGVSIQGDGAGRRRISGWVRAAVTRWKAAFREEAVIHHDASRNRTDPLVVQGRGECGDIVVSEGWIALSPPVQGTLE